MKFHLEGLKKKQLEVLMKVGPFIRERGFYLAGGSGHPGCMRVALVFEETGKIPFDRLAQSDLIVHAAIGD